ncbi:MAG: hypothetical protein M3017_15595 [Actinomycetota bacterium]|nr:hypothetical protein [Actinomycetota bacterium]
MPSLEFKDVRVTPGSRPTTVRLGALVKLLSVVPTNNAAAHDRGAAMGAQA